MNKMLPVIVVALSFFASVPALRAEDAGALVEPTAGASAEAVSEAVAEVIAAETAAPAAAASAPVEAPVVATPAPEVLTTDNLEFISGEISALDEAGKSVSVRLYGDTENAAEEKTLKVEVDENTDITDGEQDRDLKSLTAGTEVDVEYDPATNKATYIFVY